MDGSRLDTDMEVARRWKPSQIWWAGSLDTRGWSLRVSTCKLRTRNLCMLWTCYDTSVWFVLLLWELASYFIFFLEPSVSQIPLLCMAGLLFVFHYSQKRRIRQHIPAFNFEKKTPPVLNKKKEARYLICCCPVQLAAFLLSSIKEKRKKQPRGNVVWSSSIRCWLLFLYNSRVLLLATKSDKML